MAATQTARTAESERDGGAVDRNALITARSIVFNVAFYSTFAALMVLGLPALPMKRRVSLVVVRLWARVSVRLLHLICGTRVEFRNLHLLPKGASILAVKHQSFLETFALITVLDDFTYILKKELTAMPFFGWYLKATEQVALDRAKRGGALARLKRSVAEKLRAGRQVVIFPEGTRRPVGAPAEYKVGVAVLCADAGVPCTPVALNTGVFWPRRSFIRRPGTVVIEFLPPIATGLAKRDFMAALEASIEPATDALVAEALAETGRPASASEAAAPRALRA